GGMHARQGCLNIQAQRSDLMMRTRCRMLLGSMLLLGLLTTPARAQVSIDVHIGEPPPVVVYSPPTMVMLPEPQMYVAVGVPYDIFFVSGRYYYFHGDHWFWGGDTADRGPTWRLKGCLRAS